MEKEEPMKTSVSVDIDSFGLSKLRLKITEMIISKKTGNGINEIVIKDDKGILIDELFHQVFNLAQDMDGDIMQYLENFELIKRFPIHEYQLNFGS